MEKKNKFPVDAYSDAIIVDRLLILDIQQKKAKKSNITIATAAPPKNIMDIEKRRAEQMAQYDEAELKLLSKWDENPNQAIVMAVGPGRDLGNGVLLKPTVKPGQHILYRGNSGEPLVINKKLYWVIKDYDIYSIVPDKELII